MIYIDTIDKFHKVTNYAILHNHNQNDLKLIIKKYETPIIVQLEELSKFLNQFLVKEELLEWICENIIELQKKPQILKKLLASISSQESMESVASSDGTTKHQILGPKHRVEVIQDDNGSTIQIKDKKNRILSKTSIYDKKVLTTAIRNDEDNTELIVLCPKQRTKKTININKLILDRSE